MPPLSAPGCTRHASQLLGAVQEPVAHLAAAQLRRRLGESGDRATQDLYLQVLKVGCGALRPLSEPNQLPFFPSCSSTLARTALYWHGV